MWFAPIFTIATCPSTAEVITTNHPRKCRWEQLNACIAKKAKLSRDGINSSAYSSIKYADIQEIYDPLSSNYVQSIREIPETEIALLTQILEKTNDCVGRFTSGKEAKRLLFISPILVIVCGLFRGDVQIAVEEDLIGKEVKANGHFEFILKRGNKRICIVEAKKEDMQQGLAQNLIGCEVAADLDNSAVVYGIVTTYIQWTFLKSGVDKIELDEITLRVEEGHVDVDSLKQIAGKIYGMLADESM